MKYLIDTDIASYYLRGKFNLSVTFQVKGFQNLRLSRINVAELEVLAYKSPQSKLNFSSIHSFSQNLGVLEVDIEAWRIYSKIKAGYEKRGEPKGDMDFLIASVAKQYNMIVVTRNTSHFDGLVKVENWIYT